MVLLAMFVALELMPDLFTPREIAIPITILASTPRHDNISVCCSYAVCNFKCLSSLEVWCIPIGCQSVCLDGQQYSYINPIKTIL